MCKKSWQKSLSYVFFFCIINKSIITNAYPLHSIDDQVDSMRNTLLVYNPRLDKGLSLDESWHRFSFVYIICHANGTIIVEGLAHGYRDLKCSISTFNKFSYGGAYAKNHVCVQKNVTNFSPKLEQHLEDVNRVMERNIVAKIKVDIKKCFC